MIASGLRHLLVAIAALVLVHGLILRSLYPEYPQSGGRAHDGRPFVPFYSPMYEQQYTGLPPRSKEDDIREMFEFAKQPSDWRRCSAPLESLNTAPDLKRAPCPTGAPDSSYVSAALINTYQGESIMNGGLMEGNIGAFEPSGFGGAKF